MKTHCINGHERTPETVDPRNRQCRICHLTQANARYVHRPKRTHCKNGHERVPENQYRGVCYVCLKAKAKERSARIRSERKTELRKHDMVNNPSIEDIVDLDDATIRAELELNYTIIEEELLRP